MLAAMQRQRQEASEASEAGGMPMGSSTGGGDLNSSLPAAASPTAVAAAVLPALQRPSPLISLSSMRGVFSGLQVPPLEDEEEELPAPWVSWGAPWAGGCNIRGTIASRLWQGVWQYGGGGQACTARLGVAFPPWPPFCHTRWHWLTSRPACTQQWSFSVHATPALVLYQCSALTSKQAVPQPRSCPLVLITSQAGVQQWRLGINNPAMALPQPGSEGIMRPPEEVVVSFGIIDILQDYSMRKVVERQVSRLCYVGGGGDTCRPPRATRMAPSAPSSLTLLRSA